MEVSRGTEAAWRDGVSGLALPHWLVTAPGQVFCLLQKRNILSETSRVRGFPRIFLNTLHSPLRALGTNHLPSQKLPSALGLVQAREGPLPSGRGEGMDPVPSWVPFGQKCDSEKTFLCLPLSDHPYLPGFKKQTGSRKNTNEQLTSAFSLVPP